MYRVMSASLVMLLLLPLLSQAEVIHQERSAYRNILVDRSGNHLCLSFTVRAMKRHQTCKDLKDPDRLVFPYVRMVFAALLVNPKPQRMLVIGLGGGSIPVVLRRLYPNATIDVAEIDEAVVRVAQNYFDFQPDSRMRVSVKDARVFVKRALLQGASYDLVILDAFTGDYIPEHLMTVEFLDEIDRLLAPAGVLAANTFSSSGLYHHESVSYQQVFGSFYNLTMPGTANRVVIAPKTSTEIERLVDEKTLAERATLLKPALEPFAIPILDFPRRMSREIDWNPDTRPLTDQFSPANLLQQP